MPQQIKDLRTAEQRIFIDISKALKDDSVLFEDTVNLFENLKVDGLSSPVEINTPQSIIMLITQAIKKDLVESYNNLLNGHLGTAGFLLRRAIDYTVDADTIRKDENNWRIWVDLDELQIKNKSKYDKWIRTDRSATDNLTSVSRTDLKCIYDLSCQYFAHSGVAPLSYCWSSAIGNTYHSIELSSVDNVAPKNDTNYIINYERFSIYIIRAMFIILHILQMCFKEYTLLSDKFEYWFSKKLTKYDSQRKKFIEDNFIEVKMLLNNKLTTINR
ncbi:MAG: hypothetical protein WC805_01955 [Patescibacteria group bacterium]|jgi:hypothetical protein